MADFRIWIALLVVCFVSTMHAQSDDFTLVVYPDTQNEAEFYPQVLNAQTQWVVDNRASWNIQAVLGVGDIVNDGASSAQWQNADAAIRLVDNANIPYLMAIGNHDYNGANAGASTRTATGFNQWFGPARYAAYSYYKGNYPTGSNENFYGVLNIGGVNYLFLVLEYIPRAATLNWATSIVRANPDKRIIIITHSNIHSDNTRGDQCDTNDLSKDNDGEETWAALTSQYTNIIMVLSGHITGAGAARRADIAANGNLVNQMLSDYQTYPNGGNGYIRLLKFHPAQNTIDVYTYSPYIKGYKTDSANQFTLNILRPTPAATGTTTISGKVRATRAGGACAVISGATVSYGTYQTTSDASGSYTLNIPSGPVNGVVSASAQGYGQATSTTYAAPGYPGDVPLFMIPIPDYTVTATPTAQSVVQGTNSQPYSVIVTPSGGFTGNVSFSVSGLPAGTTTSFSPNLIVTSGTSQMAVSANPTAPVGTYALIITAASGSLSHTTNATITVTGAPDFSIAASPNSQSVVRGATTGAYAVTVSGQNGFSGQVTFSAIGLPAGAAANFDANPVASGATATLTVTTTAATQSGTYPFTIQGVSGSLSHAINATLTVTSAPDFSIAVAPNSQSVIPGGITALYSVNIAGQNNFSGQVTLSTVGLPAGSTANFSANPIASGGAPNLTVTTTSATQPGTYPFTIQATSGSLSHTVDGTLIVTSAPDFSIAIAPNTRSALPGGMSDPYAISITGQNGFGGSTSLSASGLPAGATASFDSNPVSAGGTSNLTVSTTALTIPGTYPFTITASSGSLSHPVAATLVVNSTPPPPAIPDFALSASPASVSVVAGAESAPLSITTSVFGGFTGDIILSTEGMPAGVTAIFDNSSPAAGSPSSLKFVVDATTAVGSYPIVITGMSGSLSHIVNATLVVLQPPDFSLSVAPSTRLIAAGETSKNYLVTPVPARGFSGDVDLTVDGLPAGATASLSTVTVAQGSSSNLQVSTDETVVPATYPLTITGTSGLLSHAATATLIVNPPATPDFDLAMSKQSVSVVQGFTATLDVTSSVSGGFADGIDIAADGLPDGVSSSLSTNPLAGSDSSTLTITAAASSAPGTYPITLTGTSGSLTHAATFDLIVKLPADFSLAASPISQSTSAGGTTGSYTISSKALNGLTGNLDLSVSGLPVGATAHFSATPVSLGTDSQLTISTLNTIATGSFDFTVSANSGSMTHSISLTLNVNAVPDFSVSLSPVSRSVEQGGTTNPYTLTVAPINGFSHDLGLSISGLPAGATGGFTPSQISAGTGSSDLTIVTTSATSPGTYPLKITLDGTTASHTVDATLTVTAAADFTLSGTPNSQTVAAGGITGSYKIGVAAQNGFTGQATLSTSGLPAGAIASFSANPLAVGVNANLTISTATMLAPGTYSFNVTAVSGSLSHNVPVTLVVTAAPDFAVSATPVSRTAMQGQTPGPFALTISAVNGFVTPVGLTVTGLPAGATATFSATTISGTGTSNLSIATSASTPPGSYSLSVNGTSGSLSHSAVVTLSVTAAAGTVSGKVTNISTGGAVSGATVSYSGGSTLTSSTGTYNFSSVPVGTVNFTATRTGYGSRTNPVGVTAGAATTADFQLATSGRLTGTVKNSAGALISSATVKIVGGLISTSVTLTTNSSGVYLSGWLPVGNYTITVSKTGYTTKAMPATVATGTTSTFNFTMQ